MSNEALFNKIKNLNWPLGQFALFGSAPLGVRNLRECRDVDVIMTESIWNAQKEKGWQEITLPHGSVGLVCDEIELWKNWYPGEWDCRKLIAESEIIDGLPFVQLKEVLRWKKLMGREKDLKDIAIVEQYLVTHS